MGALEYIASALIFKIAKGILDHLGPPPGDLTLEHRFEREVGPRPLLHLCSAFASEAPGIFDVVCEGVALAVRVAAWLHVSKMMRRSMDGKYIM